MALTTKVIAGILAGGVTVSGVVWAGTENIDNIKESVGTIQERLEQSMDDNEFLSTQYENLKTTFSGTVEEANSTINNMKRDKSILEGQIEDLEREKAEFEAQAEEGKTEVQDEINRLESELTKANEEIQELENYITDLEEQTADFEAVDRTEYETSEDVELDDGTGIFVTAEAEAFNSEHVDLMTDPATIEAIETEHAQAGYEFTIIGVDTYTEGSQEFLSYVIQPKVSDVDDIGSDAVNSLLQSMDWTQYLFFENIDGEKTGRSQIQ
ncbi:hypothetical protein [Bacillus paralicheniformis]|uniref:hypothetical protein n=1 Tax=Bacillus paralicheniformis TaxID=1648923 RepID=UPI00189ED063|nr:hypothetical protein [Bacillus paralicheniformis]